MILVFRKDLERKRKREGRRKGGINDEKNDDNLKL